MNAGISRRIRRLMAARGQDLKQFFVEPYKGGWACYCGREKVTASTKEKCLAKVDDYIRRMGIQNSVTYIDDLAEDLELFARE